MPSHCLNDSSIVLRARKSKRKLAVSKYQHFKRSFLTNTECELRENLKSTPNTLKTLTSEISLTMGNYELETMYYFVLFDVLHKHLTLNSVKKLRNQIFPKCNRERQNFGHRCLLGFQKET
jgi:hypothetical protein